MRRMPRQRRFLMFLPLILVVFALFIFAVKSLWNWLMPDLFGLPAVTYWQALGILILGKILFGGFPGGRSGPSWRMQRRMMERWEQMTPEERERFRLGLKGSWHSSGPTEDPRP